MDTNAARPPGGPPGILTSSEEAVEPEAIDVIHYSAGDFEEAQVACAQELEPYRRKPGITWVNVSGLADIDLIAGIGEAFGLHHLALEDVTHLRQRPKCEQYGEHLFLVVRMLVMGETPRSEQVSIFFGEGFVVTFQEQPGDCLEPIRDRIRNARGQIRRMGADYLMYAIMDAIIDNYFPFVDELGEEIESLETAVLMNPGVETVSRIHALRRTLLDARRACWPLREVVNGLIRSDYSLLEETTRPYLRDIYDHVLQVTDFIDIQRELVAGLMDIHLTTVSNRMNDVMKTLTVIATIFIPLTFLAGIYGMNFEKMPELKWEYGYAAVWAVMAVMTVTMLAYFYRKGWMGGRRGD